MINPADAPNEDFEYYSIPAYKAGAPIVVRGSTILSQKQLIPEKCVLFGKLNPRVEKVWFVDSASRHRRLASTEWIVLNPTSSVDQGFLYFVLWSDWVMPSAQGLVSGSTPSRERVDPSAFYQIEIPVPPVLEQRRIATILWQVRRAIEREERFVATAVELKQAAMQQLFTQGLRGEELKETEIGPIPVGWEVVPLGTHLERAQYGLSIKGEQSGKYPILRMNSQVDGRTVFRDLQFVDLDERTLGAFRLQNGDLLFNRTNSYELVGRMSIFRSEREAVFASYLIRLTLDLRVLDPDFVNYYFNRPSIQQVLKQLSSRGVGQANISASKLREFCVPVPPSLEEQQEIVELLRTMDRAIAVRERRRATLAELFDTLLHELMSGRLRVADVAECGEQEVTAA